MCHFKSNVEQQVCTVSHAYGLLAQATQVFLFIPTNTGQASQIHKTPFAMLSLYTGKYINS